MKGIRVFILLLAGFALGWVAQSVMGITMRKAANTRFLDESEGTLKGLRARIQAFKASRGRWPKGPAELGLDQASPPFESLRHSARWVGAWDGQGGFLYSAETGELYLNADLSREKLFRADWKRVLEGGLFPKGRIS
jgi:hypothetical protein